MTTLFDNIEIAFKHRTLKELKQLRFIYKYLFKDSVLRLSKFFFGIAQSIHFPVGWIVKPTIYKYYCAGETLDEAVQTAEKLNEYKVKSILDYAAEEAKNNKDAEKALNNLLSVVDIASAHSSVAFAVFKPSALCRVSVLKKKNAGDTLTDEENKEYNFFCFAVNELCKRAYNNRIPILIDAEYCSIQEVVDRIALEMMLKYNKEKALVFNTLQMYRKDRLQYLKNLYQIAIRENIYLGIKLVRGAYLEQEREWAKQVGQSSPVFDKKEETDQSYNQALRFCLENIDRIAVFSGTHNEESNQLMVELMNELGIRKDDDRVFASQLFGMSDHITYNLAFNGYNVAKYIPYGPVNITIPYLMRRAEENKSIGNQTSRELLLITKAIQLRKNK